MSPKSATAIAALVVTLLLAAGTARGQSATSARCAAGSTEAYFAPNAVDYRGRVATTVNGIPCQKWTAQSPQQHKISLDPSRGIGDHNFCRNPTGATTAGCFTTNPKVRYELCDVGAPCPLAAAAPTPGAPPTPAVPSANTMRLVLNPTTDESTNAPYIGLSGAVSVSIGCAPVSEYTCNISFRVVPMSIATPSDAVLVAPAWQQYVGPIFFGKPGRFVLDITASRAAFQRNQDGYLVRSSQDSLATRSQQYLILDRDTADPITFYPPPSGQDAATKKVYPQAVLVSITSAVPRSVTYFTISPATSGDTPLNGAPPLSSLTLYSEPFWIYSSATITAYAIDAASTVTPRTKATVTAAYSIADSAAADAAPPQLFPNGGNFTGGVNVLVLAQEYTKLLMQVDGGDWTLMTQPSFALKWAGLAGSASFSVPKTFVVRVQGQRGTVRTPIATASFVVAPIVPPTCDPAATFNKATNVSCRVPLGFDPSELPESSPALPRISVYVNDILVQDSQPQRETAQGSAVTTGVASVIAPLCCTVKRYNVTVVVSSMSIGATSRSTTVFYDLQPAPIASPLFAGVLRNVGSGTLIATIPARIPIEVPPFSNLVVNRATVGQGVITVEQPTVANETVNGKPVAYLLVNTQRTAFQVSLRAIPRLNPDGVTQVMPFDQPSDFSTLTIETRAPGSLSTQFGFVYPTVLDETGAPSLSTDVVSVAFAAAAGVADRSRCVRVDVLRPTVVVTMSCLDEVTVSALSARLLAANVEGAAPFTIGATLEPVRVLWSNANANTGMRLQAISSMAPPFAVLAAAAPATISLLGPNVRELRGRCKAVPQGSPCTTFTNEQEIVSGACVVTLSIPGTYSLCVSTTLTGVFVPVRPAPTAFPIFVNDPSAEVHGLNPAPGLRFTGNKTFLDIFCDGCHALRLNGTTTINAQQVEGGAMKAMVRLPPGRTVVSIISRTKTGEEVVVRSALYDIVIGADPVSTMRFAYSFRTVAAQDRDSALVVISVTCQSSNGAELCDPRFVRSVSLSLTPDCSDGGTHSSYLEETSSDTVLVSSTISTFIRRAQETSTEVFVCVNDAFAASALDSTPRGRLSLVTAGLSRCTTADVDALRGRCDANSCTIVRGRAYCACSGDADNNTATYDVLQTCDAAPTEQPLPPVVDETGQRGATAVFALLLLSIVVFVMWFSSTRMSPDSPNTPAVIPNEAERIAQLRKEKEMRAENSTRDHEDASELTAVSKAVEVRETE